MYLIDTMVLSELLRRQRDAGVVAWIAEQRQEDCQKAGWGFSIKLGIGGGLVAGDGGRRGWHKIRDACGAYDY